jgi:hypothetical protein
MSMDVLYQIAGMDEPWAAGRAANMIAIMEQYNSGNITVGERDELVRDLVRLDTIDQEATSLEVKTALVSAIHLVTQVV